MMLLSLFQIIPLDAFFGEITGFTAAIVLGANLYLVNTYC